MPVDMSPQAVTDRMKMLDQLWELSVALKSSKIAPEKLAKARKDPEAIKRDPKVIA